MKVEISVTTPTLAASINSAVPGEWGTARGRLTDLGDPVPLYSVFTFCGWEMEQQCQCEILNSLSSSAKVEMRDVAHKSGVASAWQADGDI